MFVLCEALEEESSWMGVDGVWIVGECETEFVCGGSPLVDPDE